VLTPLMMDFGYKGSRPPGEGRVRRFHYDIRVGKPIVGQVVDVFRAIRMYVKTESAANLTDKFPSLQPGTERLFEIYPFLGLNPANYSLQEVSELLIKYFELYTGRRADFRDAMGQFDGNIDNLRAHAFAGIKVYPPLGFDPWPEGNDEAMAKARLVYETCSSKGIPITAHGGEGGFVVVDAIQLNTFASPSKWACVLKSYPNLKLNLAHFPMDRLERARRKETLDLLLEYPNVYVDISCRGTSEVYYHRLKALFKSLPEKKLDRLRCRILFGSDFPVSLRGVESYNKYLDLFSLTPSLTPQEKNLLCSTNPARFLFHDDSP
jgi:predicted TIM-barrel fold metal-dependent hydrolase